MLNLKHILFPLDFSERACGTAPFVAAIANRFEAKVTLLGVAQPLIYGGLNEPSYPVMFDPETIRQSVDAQLHSVLKRELAGIEVDRVAELGDPADTISKFAREHKVDLIMIPTHGHSAFRSLVLGSVTDSVLREAECAIWTSTHTERAPFKEQAATRKILCAVGADETAVGVLSWAANYAKQWGACLKVVHAVENCPHHEPGAHAQCVAAIDHIAAMAGAETPVSLVKGSVTEAITAEAKQQNVDLVIIGRAPKEKPDRLKTNHAVIRQAPCPVISV